MSQNQKLMAEFPPVSTDKWESVITADLKGADYDKKLVWKTLEGFAVRPYYRAEDLSALKFLDSKPGCFPYVRGTKATNSWSVSQSLEVLCAKEANVLAKDFLARGARIINFVINDKEFTAESLKELLDGICVESNELAFSGCAALKVGGLFVDLLEAASVDPEKVFASFGIDPIKKASTKGAICSGEKCFDNIVELVKKAAKYKRIRVVSVGGVLFDNAGADVAQQLGYTLSMAHEYLVKTMGRGLAIDQIAPVIRFVMPIGVNYFMEIAKFRALRMMWATVVAPYKPSRGCAERAKVAAVTSAWNQTVYDPYVNMLRGTTEAMSAAIAGVDSIEVLPFDAPYAKPSEFSSRIARNTQILLKEESHLDQVVDAAGGSYYIENLTDILATKAWELFKEVEAKGGYLAALKAGFIQEQVAAKAAIRIKNIATRRDTLLGTNEFPNFTEVAAQSISEASVSPATCGCGCTTEKQFPAMAPYRAGMEFEQLRLKSDRSDKTPLAFMLTCGSLSFARARSQFACNFFACAGIRVQDNTYFKSVAQGVEASLEAKAAITVICASDDDYLSAAIEAYNELKGKSIVVVAGNPECRAELEKAGVTHFISARDNVLETLKQYQTELGI